MILDQLILKIHLILIGLLMMWNKRWCPKSLLPSSVRTIFSSVFESCRPQIFSLIIIKTMQQMFYLISGKTFMHVVQSRALSGLSLFGNMGGYIGIFLGFALMQLPDFLNFMYHQCKKLAK